MTYSFQQRLDLLGQRMRAVNSETVSIQRGGYQITGVLATPAMTEIQEFMSGVPITQIRYQDWIIKTADYDFGDGLTLPAQGDLITRANGEIFKAVSLAEDTPPFEYTTATKKRLRIHTEHVGNS